MVCALLSQKWWTRKISEWRLGTTANSLWVQTEVLAGVSGSMESGELADRLWGLVKETNGLVFHDWVWAPAPELHYMVTGGTGTDCGHSLHLLSQETAAAYAWGDGKEAGERLKVWRSIKTSRLKFTLALCEGNKHIKENQGTVKRPLTWEPKDLFWVPTTCL